MASLAHTAFAPAGPELDGRRVAASLVDLVVAFAIAVALGVAVGGEADLAVQALWWGWVLLYFVALESGGGQTLGKRLLRLRVVSVDGSMPGIGRIVLRNLVRVIDWGPIGLIVMVATGRRRQRLGDLAARTIVVSAESEPAPPPAPTAAAGPALPAGSTPIRMSAAAVAPPAPLVTPPVEVPPAEASPPEPEEPVVGEPVVEEPVVEAPTVQEPAVEEPAPEGAPAAPAPVAADQSDEPRILSPIELMLAEQEQHPH